MDKKGIKNYFKIIKKKLTKKGLEQDLNILSQKGKPFSNEMSKIARQAAAEGIVLLENNGLLPLKKEDDIAVFGRSAIDYFAVGYGSGGDVSTPYVINIIEGLQNQHASINQEILSIYENWCSNRKNKPSEDFEWGKWPFNFAEMPLNNKIVSRGKKDSSVALIVIGRAAGEDRENRLKKGSYYLTNSEKKMIKLVTKHFENVIIVMNCGNIIDMSWFNQYKNKISALLYAWQGGMEGGNAVADVLYGKVSPSGRLPITIPTSYQETPTYKNFGSKKFNNYVEDIYIGYRFYETFYKQRVLYPFGYGLSYAEFRYESTATRRETKVSIKTTIKNISNYSSNDVLQIYLSLPQGKLGQPKSILVGYVKTKLIAPGASEKINIAIDLKDFASYDDTGVTGNKNTYILEKGQYRVFVGSNVLDKEEIIRFMLPSNIIVKKTTQALAINKDYSFKRMINQNGKLILENTPTDRVNLKERILNELPNKLDTTESRFIFDDIIKGKCSIEQFVSQLSLEELDDLLHGEGNMNSSEGPEGNAGAFGGITTALKNLGIPVIIVTDGPAGIRLKESSSLIPSGTTLAATFNDELVQDIYSEMAKEMKLRGSNVLLAPGMNIQRDLLCGRNFEYFSEDPFLTGKMAAAVVNGLQKNGVAATPKHFAANNQESNRNKHDSRVSERALREIYLKAFEIMIKDSHPESIMTSYNKINGIWSHYNYDLNTTILRNEWGYRGLVMTDWWMSKGQSKEFPLITNDAYRIRAQVDLLMPGGDGNSKNLVVGRTLLDSYGQKDGITLGEIQRSAINVLTFIVNAYMKGNVS